MRSRSPTMRYPMSHLQPTKPLFAGGCAGALLAGVCVLLLDANLNDGVEVATVVPSLVNCAAI